MKFSASKALSESFEILTGRFGPMVVVAAIFTFVPAVIFMGFVVSTLPSMAGLGQNPGAILGLFGEIFGKMILFFLIYLLIRTVGTLAMCIAAGDRRNMSVGDIVGEAVRGLLPMLGIYALLLVAYLVIALLIAATVGMSMGAALSGRDAPGAGMGLSLVVMFFGLFGLICWLWAKLSMVLPVIALDGERNPINALSRSWALTRGAAFKIFLLFLLALIGAMVVNWVIGLASGGMAADPTALDGPGFWINLLISMAVGTVIGMYFIALIVAIHHQLAGPSTAEVSDTFA